MIKKSNFFSVYIFVILGLIVLPINNIESKLNTAYLLNLRLDYLVHIFLFSPWMMLCPKTTIVINAGVWVFIGLLFAAASEAIQYPLPYRSFNLNDLLANSLGVIIGILPYYFIKRNETAFSR